MKSNYWYVDKKQIKTEVCIFRVKLGLTSISPRWECRPVL